MQIQFRQAIKAAMCEEMRKDDSIFLMGEEVGLYNGAYKVSQGMLEEFGSQRVFDTPISELGFTGLGIGAAMNGLRPIIEFMTFNFSLVAIDQLINSAAKICYMSGGQFHIPIVFRGPTGSAGMLGAQHSQNFENWFANCPGIKVVIPSNPFDAKGLLKSAIIDNDPVIFLESELMYNDVQEIPNEEYYIPIGKAVVMVEGDDLTLVSFGKMIPLCQKVVVHYENKGISIELIDLRTVRPIDFYTIFNSVRRTNRLIIVEEAWPLASIASEIAYQVQKHEFDYLDAPIAKINSEDVPLAYSEKLVEATLPNFGKIVDVIDRMIS